MGKLLDLMGNLTTLTIYNDRLREIVKNPEQFVRELNNVSRSYQKTQTIFGQTKVQQTRHASNPAIYVQMGNTCCLIDPYSDETRDLANQSPDFYKEIISYMEQTLKGLKDK